MTEELLLLLDKYKKNNNTKEYKKVRDKIIELNMNFAQSIARRFCEQSYFDYEDIESLAFEGLIKSVDQYNLDIGLDYLHYAYTCIINNIANGIRNKYELTHYLASLFIKTQKIVQNEYCKKYIPGDIDMLKDILTILKDEYNVSIKDIEKIYNVEMIKGAYYNNYDVEKIYCSEDNMLNGIIYKMLQDKVNRKLSKLAPQRRFFIKLRYGFYGKELSRVEISDRFHMSRTVVKQGLYRGLKNLKSADLDMITELYNNLDNHIEYGIDNTELSEYDYNQEYVEGYSKRLKNE